MITNLPTLKFTDNYLNKEFTLKPNVYVSTEGRLVVCYESRPQNYADFGDDDKSADWDLGDENHITLPKPHYAVMADEWNVAFPPHAGNVWINGESKYARSQLSFTREQAVELAKRILEELT